MLACHTFYLAMHTLRNNTSRYVMALRDNEPEVHDIDLILQNFNMPMGLLFAIFGFSSRAFFYLNPPIETDWGGDKLYFLHVVPTPNQHTHGANTIFMKL